MCSNHSRNNDDGLWPFICGRLWVKQGTIFVTALNIIGQFLIIILLSNSGMINNTYVAEIN